MVYTLEQISDLIAPIAIKYDVLCIWIFGSYARGEASEESDIDIVFNYDGSNALRNRIVHNYGSVSSKMIIDIVVSEIPKMEELLLVMQRDLNVQIANLGDGL